MHFEDYWLQVFSIIIFGSILSQGWRYEDEEEVCIINNSYATCQLATTVGVLAFIVALGTAASRRTPGGKTDKSLF